MDSLSAWTEWRDRCALGLCEPATQSLLRSFAATRFANYLVRYAHRTNLPDRDAARLAPADPWHLFETHLALGATRSGKSYKQWLFARVELADDPPLDVVQGGATLLLRDVVREFLRRECPPPHTVSLDESGHGDEEPLSIEDLLPANTLPTAEVERREWESLARVHAGELTTQLEPRERIALVAKELGVSLAHPAILQLAGCSRSMLNLIWRRLFERIAHQLRARYHQEDPPAVLQLTLLTVAEIGRRLLEQFRLESAWAPFFLLKEDQRAVALEARETNENQLPNRPQSPLATTTPSSPPTR